jgi:signal transduction histidine kinase/GAF domain-containing protein
MDMALFGRASSDLPQDLQRWSEAMEATLRINEIASSQRPLDDSVQDMLAIAVDLLGAEHGSIMLVEDTGPTLVVVAVSGVAGNVPIGGRVAIGESVAGRVLATERPLLLDDVNKDHYVNFIPKTRSIATSVVVPLRIQGGSIGVLSLAKSEGAARFVEEDLRVAQLFADQAAGLIHRARLHEKAERRSADLLALVASSEGLLGTLDLDELLQRVLDGALRVTAAQEGLSALFDPEGGALSRGCFRGFDRAEVKHLLARPEIKEAVTRGEVYSSASEGDGALVSVGLRTSRRTPGLIVLRPSQSPAEDRLSLLRAFAQQAATAIGAAELHNELGRKESELSSIILGLPNPIVVVDAPGRLTDVNPSAEQLFSISAPFSRGQSVTGYLGNPEIEQMLTGRGELESEVTMGSPLRTYRARVMDVRPASSPGGRVLIMVDLTGERAIAQTQRDFVAMIGHELRTPLTIIKGFARTALKMIESPGAGSQREALETIDAKAAQLGRLIEDLLYVSKIESREATLRVEDVDVGVLVESVVTEVLHDHPDREVALEIPHGLTWPCDETKVALILRHLTANALKYSDAPQPVAVHVRTEDDELRLSVVDKGIGLLSTDIPHIFERFRQVDSSSTRERGGTGVGLYLCAQLVRVHGGRIWVESMWGKGSEFSFAIPRRPTTKVVRMAMRPVTPAAS